MYFCQKFTGAEQTTIWHQIFFFFFPPRSWLALGFWPRKHPPYEIDLLLCLAPRLFLWELGEIIIAVESLAVESLAVRAHCDNHSQR